MTQFGKDCGFEPSVEHTYELVVMLPTETTPDYETLKFGKAGEQAKCWSLRYTPSSLEEMHVQVVNVVTPVRFGSQKVFKLLITLGTRHSNRLTPRRLRHSGRLLAGLTEVSDRLSIPRQLFVQVLGDESQDFVWEVEELKALGGVRFRHGGQAEPTP